MGDGRETRDFMSVDSFSQLPFMRRHPPPTPPIRLFGFDFPPHPSPAAAPDSTKRSSSSSSFSPNAAATTAGEAHRNKFDCNYCFRNFPTSQALGGHQNAHKRERHNAKRANLAAASCFGGHLPSLLGYPSWSFPAGGRRGGVPFYGGLGSVAQPINGNPMSAMHHRRRHHSITAAAVPAPSLSLLRAGQERRTTPSGECHEPKDAVSLDLHL